MDHRKQKLGDGKKSNEEKNKEAALDRLRQMEWMRNKQDTWHLARANNSRSVTLHEKKKFNQNEDSYFEGTSRQKDRRPRKPKEESQKRAPPGFPITASASAYTGPPPVNAWAQKKGSSLFAKAQEIDEEDEMMKLALKESIRTAEEDEKRHLERIRMMNSAMLPSVEKGRTQNDYPGKEQYQSDEEEEDISPSLPEFQKQASNKSNLYFVDTDSGEEAPDYKQRSKFTARSRNVTDSSKNIFVPSEFKKKETLKDPGYNMFKPTQPQENLPVKLNDSNVYSASINRPQSSSKPTVGAELNRSIMLPERDTDPVPSVNGLAAGLRSTLTFGDTGGLLEDIKNQAKKQQSMPSTQLNSTNLSKTNINPPSQLLELGKTSPLSYPDETDIMLHSFIRHDPPPQPQKTESLEMNKSEVECSPTALGTSPQYFIDDVNLGHRESILNGLLPRDHQSGSMNSIELDTYSLSPLSNSPLQNNTPYGSVERQIPFGNEGNVHLPSQISQFPFQYQIGLPLNQENSPNSQTSHVLHPNLGPPPSSNPMQPATMGLQNQHIGAGIPFQSVPGYMSPNPAFPLNPHIPNYPQFCHPNSNVILGSMQGQDMMSSAQAAQLQQQYMAMRSMHIQQAQAQFAALSANGVVAENTDPNTREDTNPVTQMLNQTEVQNSNSQPELVPQNPMQLPNSQLHYQNSMATLLNQSQVMHIQSHPQVMPMQEPNILQQDVQQMDAVNQSELRLNQETKSKQEILMMQYHQTMQTLAHLRNKLAETQEEVPTVPIQPQTQFIHPTNAMQMGMNTFLPKMPVLHQTSSIPMNPQMPPTAQLSPDLQHDAARIPGFYNMGANVINAMEPKMGRGRGRLP